MGKTTSLMCLARTLLGSSYKKAVLRLNASDERYKRSMGYKHLYSNCRTANEECAFSHGDKSPGYALQLMDISICYEIHLK